MLSSNPTLKLVPNPSLNEVVIPETSHTPVSFPVYPVAKSEIHTRCLSVVFIKTGVCAGASDFNTVLNLSIAIPTEVASVKSVYSPLL